MKGVRQRGFIAVLALAAILLALPFAGESPSRKKCNAQSTGRVFQVCNQRWTQGYVESMVERKCIQRWTQCPTDPGAMVSN